MPEFVIHDKPCSAHTSDAKSNTNCEPDPNQPKSKPMFDFFHFVIWLIRSIFQQILEINKMI